MKYFIVYSSWTGNTENFEINAVIDNFDYEMLHPKKRDFQKLKQQIKSIM